MSCDPISDMLAKLKNASQAKHSHVDIPLSKIKLEILKLMKEEGFIRALKPVERNKMNWIRVFLKYTREREPTFSEIRRVSKQSCRVYSKAKGIPRILNGLGVVIISTPRGITTGKKAREEWNTGGEVLCYMW